MGKSVYLNHPGKKHNSGFGLPPISVTKIHTKNNGFAVTSKVITLFCPLLDD